MKKLTILLGSAFVLLSCNGVKMGLGLDLKDEDFELEGITFQQTGVKGPIAYQELNRFSYQDSDGERIVSELSFRDGKMTLVFPSGGYRTVGYTLDRNTHTIAFDAPVIYGSTIRHQGVTHVGENVTKAKYEMMTLSATMVEGKDLMLSLYDVAAADFSSVDMEKGQWSLSVMSVNKPSLPPVYPLVGEYGTTLNPHQLVEGEDKPYWSQECIADGHLFPWVKEVDLARIHYGPAWRYPTAAEVEELLELSECTGAVGSDGQKTFHVVYLLSGEEVDGKMFYDTLSFPYAAVSDGLCSGGIWLADGRAFVYSYDYATREVKAEIVQPGPAATYFVRAVK